MGFEKIDETKIIDGTARIDEKIDEDCSIDGAF